MKLASQMPSSTSLIPRLWPASTVEMLILLRCRQMRPQAVTRTGLGQVQLEPADVLGCGRVGGPLQKRGKSLAAADVAPLRPRTELAGIHGLEHPLAQRGDGRRTHGKRLSWIGLHTPRSSS